MSRSYKKEPYLKYAPMGNSGQILANRRIRRGKYKGEDIPSGGYYKKLYEQWDIHDCVDYYPLEKWLERWRKWQVEFPGDNWYGKDLEDAIWQWKKRYILK